MAVTCACYFSVESQNTSSKTSTVKFWVETYSSGGSHNGYGASSSVTFSGSYSGTRTWSSIIKADTTTRVYETTITVQHDSSGNATVNANVTIVTGISSGTIYANKSFPLPTISTGGGSSGGDSGGGSTTSKGNITVSGTKQLGNRLTISTGRPSSSYTYTLAYSWGNASGTIATGVGASTTWTPPISMATGVTDATSATCVIMGTVYYNGSYDSMLYYSFTLSIPSTVKPSISVISVEDPNGYFDTYNAFSSGKSALDVNVTAAGSYGSTIESYAISFNGTRKTTNPASFGIFSGVGSYYVYVTVTDSRGRTATSSKLTNWTNTKPPDLGGTWAKRWSGSTDVEDITGTRIKYHCQGTLSSGSSGTVVVKYRTAVGSTMTQVNRRTVGTSWSYDLYTTGVDPDTRYYVEITCTDSNGVATVYSTYIETDAPIMDFRHTGKGVAIGKVSETDKLEVALATDLQNGLNVEGATTLETLTASSTTNLNGAVNIGGAATFKSTSAFQQVATVSSELRLAANADITMGSSSAVWVTNNNSTPTIARDTVLNNNIAIRGKMTSGTIMDILSIDSANRLALNWGTAGLSGMVRTVLWSGDASPYNAKTNPVDLQVEGHMAYNIFIISFGGNERCLAIRQNNHASGGYICGIGGTSSGDNNNHYIMGVRLQSRSASTIRYVSGLYMLHAANGSHNETQRQNLKMIEGLI